MKHLRTFAAALTLSLIVVANANAATLTVTSTVDSGAGSLRQAIADAVSDDTITFDASLSGQTITLTNGELLLDKNLTIDASALARGIVVDGNHATLIFHVEGATVGLKSLTIINGGYDYGSGIFNRGSVTVERSTLKGNYGASDGGAIWNSGTMTVNQCTITGNQGYYIGGGIFNTGTLTVNNSTITGNISERPGSGILNNIGAVLNLTNSIVAGNQEGSRDVWFQQFEGPESAGTFHARNNFINTDPTAPPFVNDAVDNIQGTNPQVAPLGNYGGPTQTMPPLPGSPAIDAGSDTAASQFTTDQRGYQRLVGAHVDIGAVEIQTDVVVTSSADSGSGSLRDALLAVGSARTITFATNLSGQTIMLTSGELLLDKNLTIDASALANGIAINGGGAYRVFEIANGITNVLTGLTITNGVNGGGYGGGGIYNGGTLTVNQCTLSGNHADFDSGGGIGNVGTLTVNQSTLFGNQGDGGGGIYNGGTLTVNQSTLSGNLANSGGGIWNNSGTLTVNNSTFANNSAGEGGGIYNYSGYTLNLANSIVCSNMATFSGPNIFGSISSGANNLVDADAMLAPLANYGGPTMTMPPLPRSPAIDAAIGATLTTDQRGFLRPVDGDTNGVAIADIGAVEFAPLPPLAGSYNGLFFETAGVVHEHSGFFTAKLAATRKFSGKFMLAGKKYSLSGQFNGLGYASNSIARTGLSSLTVRLYSMATNEIFGFVSDGTWTATLNSDRAVFNVLTNPCPQAAKYTMSIDGGLNAATSPIGYGFGAVTIDAAGKIALKGLLADGTKIGQKTLLSKDNQWPLYVPIKSGGSILSWVTVYSNAPKSFNGDLVWTKKANALAKNYPLGFTNMTEIAGSQYVAPATGTRILNFSAGAAFLDGGNFNNSIVTFTLGTDNKVTSLTAGFSLKFKTATGLFSGKVIDPLTLNSVPFAGAVNQNENQAFGFFLEANQSGSVRLEED